LQLRRRQQPAHPERHSHHADAVRARLLGRSRKEAHLRRYGVLRCMLDVERLRLACNRRAQPRIWTSLSDLPRELTEVLASQWPLIIFMAPASKPLSSTSVASKIARDFMSQATRPVHPV